MIVVIMYSPTNKSKNSDKSMIIALSCAKAGPSPASRANKLLQQFLCTSAKNVHVKNDSAPVNFFYFIFLGNRKWEELTKVIPG